MVRLTGIIKRYNQFKLGPINYTFNPGKSYCIMGKSGSGKSTLVNLIGMLEVPDVGDIELMGKKNPKINTKIGRMLLKNNISYMFQNYGLIDNETVRENLLLVNNKNNDIMTVLKYVGLEDKIDQKIVDLSGGEQQRIAIAKVLIKNSKLIICDEPTGNLDEETGDEIMNLLINLVTNEKILIVVTHNPKYKEQFDEIINL